MISNEIYLKSVLPKMIIFCTKLKWLKNKQCTYAFYKIFL